MGKTIFTVFEKSADMQSMNLQLMGMTPFLSLPQPNMGTISLSWNFIDHCHNQGEQNAWIVAFAESVP
jgi:hypothetical protein